jgi:hypothetical protein
VVVVVLVDVAEVVVAVDELVVVGTVVVVVEVVVVVGNLGAHLASRRWANLEAQIGA